MALYEGVVVCTVHGVIDKYSFPDGGDEASTGGLRIITRHRGRDRCDAGLIIKVERRPEARIAVQPGDPLYPEGK